MLNQNSPLQNSPLQNTPIQSRSVQSKPKISLNIAFVYVLVVVLIGFGEREEIAEGISELAELTVSAINPNPQTPVFQTYRGGVA